MNEEMRKEFKEWIIKSNIAGRAPSFIMKNENGTYIDPQAVYLWLAWQASREAMKPIKLPMWCVTSDGPSKYLLQYEVIEAIQQAGYKAAE